MCAEVLWYLVLGSCALLYVILDGFDLGVGVLHLLAKNDRQRRLLINAIGPVWDGNEVWIVVTIGGLFAGFPNAYATILSGFYTPLMALITALMFRASAIEFRSKCLSLAWRQTWDVVFSVSSIGIAFVLGLILANMVVGIALNEEQDFVGNSIDFVSVYSVLMGFTAIALFAMHGSIYLAMKVEGQAHEVVRKWINPAIGFFSICYVLTTMATFFYAPHMAHFIYKNPVLLSLPLLSLVAILTVPYQIKRGNDGWAFIFSSLSIALLLALFSAGTFPVFIPSTLNPAYNLTIYNTASSPGTLKILLLIASLGMPLVFCYSFWVYRTFRGKVKLDKTSY